MSQCFCSCGSCFIKMWYWGLFDLAYLNSKEATCLLTSSTKERLVTDVPESECPRSKACSSISKLCGTGLADTIKLHFLPCEILVVIEYVSERCCDFQNFIVSAEYSSRRVVRTLLGLKSLLMMGLEKEMVTHSSILAWRISWTGEPSRLQSTGSQSQKRLSD